MRCAALLLLLASASLAAEADLDKVKSAAAIYDANRAKFSVWTIEFDYTVAYAKTLEDALAKRWTNPSIGHGVCTSDGTNGRYDLAFSLKDLVEHRTEVEPGHFQTHLSVDRRLTDGQVSLYDFMRPNNKGTDLIHVIQIHAGKDEYHRGVSLPLQLGREKFAFNYLTYEADKFQQADSGRRLTVREGVKLGDDEVVEFAFTGPDDRSEDHTYWVDLKHGAIIRKNYSEYPIPDGTRGRSYAFEDDIRDVGEGRWFPFRRLSFNECAGIVHELVYTRAEFSIPTDPLAFTLTFEKPVKVYDGTKKGSYPPQLLWDLRALPLLVAPPRR